MFSKKEMAYYSSMPLDDGNNELIEFYEKHFDFLTKCSPTAFDNSAEVLMKLAVKLHNLLEFPSQWKIYAAEMGITDNMRIAIIEESARVHGELALTITMTGALQKINGKLSNIIKALLNIPRYDALAYLRPHVQKLLDRKNTSINREQISNKRIPRIEEFLLSRPPRQLSHHFALALKSELSTNHQKYEVESLQRNMCSENSITESRSLPCLNSSEQNCKELPVEEVDFCAIHPSAPVEEEKLSVFIQHTEQDTEVARELCIRMKKLGILVRTSSDVEKLLMMDCTSALSAILKEVDFIVPVVSQKFFQQIHPHMDEKYIESSDALTNRTLYQLINTQYQSNRCVNFKVRPVLLPDINRGQLTSDVVLFYGLRLWEEFPKLIRILKETKELVSQYPFY